MDNYQKIYTKWLFIWLPCNAKCGFCNTANGFWEKYGFLSLYKNNSTEFKNYDEIVKEIIWLEKKNYTTIVYESSSFRKYKNFERIIEFWLTRWIKKQKFHYKSILDNERLYLSKLWYKYWFYQIVFSKKLFDEIKWIFWFDMSKFLELDKIKIKLDEYKDEWVKCVVYEWGDFSIYPQIFEVLEYWQRLWLEQTFQTNWIKLADIDYVNKLKKYWVKDINFSLHSYDKDVSNRMMGIDSGFEDTIKWIKNCVNVWMTVSQNVVITLENLDDLEYILLLSIKLNIDLISFILFIPPEDQIREKDEDYMKKYTTNPIIVGEKISKWLNILTQIEKIAWNKLINIKFHNIPLCLLNNEILNSREYIFDIFRKKEDNWDYTLWTGFYKKEECSKCKLNTSCTGITEYYVEKFGNNYIIPIV